MANEEKNVSKTEFSDGMKMIADVLNKVSDKEDRPINVDVKGRTKRVRSAKLQKKIDTVNKRLLKRVEFSITSPADDVEAARGYQMITTNGKNWPIPYDTKVMVPVFVVTAYEEARKLEKEAVDRRRSILKAQAKKASKIK